MQCEREGKEKKAKGEMARKQVSDMGFVCGFSLPFFSFYFSFLFFVGTGN